MKRGMLDRTISLVLSLALLMSLLTGCGRQKTPDTTVEPMTPVVDKQEIVDAIAESIQAVPLVVSTNYEDYIGDIETFICGLLTRQLEYKYDVFPAYAELSDGTAVYGLAYTDYSECLTNDDESEVYFAVGLLPFAGEMSIPQEEFDSGLMVYNLDVACEGYNFFLKYSSEAFSEHCVVYGQYVKYGADENGYMFYETAPYERGVCDETLGSLYSYDDGRYVLDIDVGTYAPVSGESLSSQIDYEELERLINECLENQDKNFAKVDIVSNLYFAQEAVISYLLSLQEETFLGYDVDLLIEEAEKLDPKECIQITETGLEVINISDIPSEGTKPLVEWLVGASCIMVTAVGLVGSVVFIECPPLSAAAGAVTGAAIDIFMQVVISNNSLADVDWTKVALAVATGAVTGFLGPYMMAIQSAPVYFLADSALDGIMGGIEYTVAAWLDGAEGREMIESFGLGVALGFGLSSAFKGAGKIAGKLLSKAEPAVTALSEKVFPKVSSRISDFSNNIASQLTRLKTVADHSAFHSEYVANKMAFRQLARLIDGSDELQRKTIRHLSNLDMVDADGNIVTKKMIGDLLDETQDGTVIAYINLDQGAVKVINRGGLPDMVFDGQSVTLDRLVDNRTTNFTHAAEKLKEKWMADPSQIPQSIKAAISDSGVELANMSAAKLRGILRNRSNGYVLHESIDMKTVTLVSIELHDAVKHMGGYGVAKFIKACMGSVYFDRFLAAASSGLVEATN